MLGVLLVLVGVARNVTEEQAKENETCFRNQTWGELRRDNFRFISAGALDQLKNCRNLLLTRELVKQAKVCTKSLGSDLG